MEKVANLSKKFFLSTRNIPEKKTYIEFFTAILSVPVLITVIMLNINNLKSTNTPNKNSAIPEQKKETVYVPVTMSPQKTSKILTPENTVTPSPVVSIIPTSQACKTEIGPISISSPVEGDTVNENPVSIIVSYKTGEYCAVVWSYRINSGGWSDYDDKSIALYNLPQGKIKADIKVKSIVTGQEQVLTRNFIYKGEDTPITPTAPPAISGDIKNSSSSAN